MAETITVPRPHVPFGPEGVPADRADAAYLRSFVRNLDYHRDEHGVHIAGSNLTATVRRLLLDAANALDPEPHDSGTTG